ncbi:hypothetical protein [Streptomyces albidoflavus]|uniref:hypothetical protein n=1 Tax=Streptomyces albidoflavus TaxID=1886 RepID=UPI00117C8446|nr:hypothetical protein [Streptomyces albidoflavus]
MYASARGPAAPLRPPGLRPLLRPFCLAAVACLAWLLTAPPPAHASDCGYASIGDGGESNVSVSTDGDCSAGPLLSLIHLRRCRRSHKCRSRR